MSNNLHVNVKRGKSQKFLEKETVKNDEHLKNSTKLPINKIVHIHIGDIRKIGNCCGIYVLINRSGETYVGSSINIKRRVSHHINNNEFGRIESVIIFKTANIGEAKDLEITLIKETKTDLNRYYYTSTIYKLKDVIRSLFRYSRN